MGWHRCWVFGMVIVTLGCDETGQDIGAWPSPTSGGSSAAPSPADGAGSSAGAEPGGGGAGSSAGAESGGGGAGSLAGAESGGGAGRPASDGSILSVWPSVGCGKPTTGQYADPDAIQKLPTSGTKTLDCDATLPDGEKKVCGPWSVEREYVVRLPVDYDPNKPYPLLFQQSTCRGRPDGVYKYEFDFRSGVILVGVSPAPEAVGHGTRPGKGCHDDEGDDSIDFVLYERLMDRLKGELCVDENRVFAGGWADGAVLASELICKYSGDTNGYAIRAGLISGGTLAPAISPTCSGKPVSAFWMNNVDSRSYPFGTTKADITKALQNNGCSSADYDSMTLDYYLVPGADGSLCKRVLGCPAEHPFVVCALPGDNIKTDNQRYVYPIGSKFFQDFSAPPLLE